MRNTYFEKYFQYNLRDFSRTIPLSIRGGLLLLFCLGVFLFLMFLGVRKGLKWSARLALIEYLVVLLIVAVLGRMVLADRAFDFTPFWSYLSIRDGNRFLLTQIIANVVAFIPVGLLLGISFLDIEWWKVLLIGGAFSFLIETLQFITKRGFAEFDDVFHNVIGCAIGYGVYLGIAYLVKKMRKRRVSDVR